MGYIKSKYDDTEVRVFTKQFLKEVFNLNFESHKNLRGIDLVNVEDKEFGIELERGGWKGDLWNNGYSLMSGTEFRTVNIPIRKTKYWFDKKNDIYLPHRKKNWFIRTNRDFTQVILIKPRTIRDMNKIMFTEFKPNNSNEMEKWMSFRQEHVLTYNLKNEKWRQQRKK
jgi:hypothetical protein